MIEFTGGGINVFRHIFCAAAFVAAFPTFVTGNEIDGFRLGMTKEQATKVAADQNYTFSNVPGTNPKWVSYVLFKDNSVGPSISLCDNVLSSVSKTYKSNLHEFTNSVERWTRSLGVPDETTASQMFVQGVPFSSLRYKWEGQQENLRQDMSFSQHGTNDLQISYGYGYINHQCRALVR